MPIQLQIQTPIETLVSYHEVAKVESFSDFSSVTVYVKSYPGEATYLSGVNVAWMWEIPIPASALLAISVSEIERVLTSTSGSPLEGGALLTGLTDFQKAKVYKRTSVKSWRDAQEFDTFTYNGMTFDGDVNAQRRLSGVVSAAKSAIAAGQTFTKKFTLADNSVVQLTAEDFIGIEMSKLWQVDVAFQEYRLKTAAIEAAATLEELEAITI